MSKRSKGRPRTVMTAERQARVIAVQRAYRKYQERRDAERARVYARLNEELDRASQVELEILQREIREALETGVPRHVLQTTEVLGSTDQGKVKRLLGPELDAAVKIRREGSSFEWLDVEEGRARIAIRGFDTTSEAPDYPAILSGVVEREPAAPGGWAVVVDDSDVDGPDGLLRWELARDHQPGHLGDAIEALAIAEGTP